MYLKSKPTTKTNCPKEKGTGENTKIITTFILRWTKNLVLSQTQVAAQVASKF